MLLHIVLAVLYSSLLVSAQHLDVFGNIVEDAEVTNYPYYGQNENKIEYSDFPEDDVWRWSPDTQQVMGAHPTHRPSDLDSPEPKLPHHLPKPPQHPPVPPHHPHAPPKKGPFPPGAPPRYNVSKTIYEILQSQPHFSRIFKLVNATDDITKLLNDSTVNVTFFATPDWAFPKRKHPSRFLEWEEFFREGVDNVEDWLTVAETLINSNYKPNKDVLLKILKSILLYETLPSRLTASDLGKNTTVATSLTLSDGSFDGQPLRVRTSTSPGFHLLHVNLYATVLKGDVLAANGLIHVTNHPVLPPPSAFQIVFLSPDLFSVLGSAIQRVGLTDAVDWRNTKDNTIVGSPAVTFFAPTNRAFLRLPRKLKTFLFSPFGERALKKLLQFHVVPEFVLHTNFFHNVSESHSLPTQYDADLGTFYEHLEYDVQAVSEAYTTHSETASLFARGDGSRSPSVQCGCGKVARCARADGPHQHTAAMPSPVDQDYEIFEREVPCECEGQDSHFYHHKSFCPGHSGHDHYPLPPPYPYRSLWCPHDQEDHRPFHYPGNDHHSPSPFPGQDTRPPLFPGRPKHPIPRPISVVYKRNVTAPTLLANHSLPVHVVQFAHRLPLPGPVHRFVHYSTAVFANGVHVKISDISTRNGALHITDRLLNPFKQPKRPHHAPKDGQKIGPYVVEDDVEDEWADWEEWLPAWAAED